MFPYMANTESDREEMIKKIGVNSTEDLFSDIPKDFILNHNLNIPFGLSELETERIVKDLSKKNKSLDHLVCFLGAGTYDHYIPSVIKHLRERSEFLTAYTPYQPEVSQGTLQTIFEYQSMICALTGMEVSNSSMYDGATATVEAAIMAVQSTKREKILVSKTVNPEILRVLKTYMHFKDYEVIEIDDKDGVTDTKILKENLNKDIAGVIVQNPNFFGIIEDVVEIENLVHQNKSKLILNVDPLSLGVLKSPGEIGADIVVGDGQSLGCNISFGGPGFGFLNTNKKLMRKMPGRIVGETTDDSNNRGYVLTLQAREQHIRREKATSNICSDQTLMGIGAAMYMATMGKSGIKEVGEQCISKSQYLYNSLINTGKYKPVFEGKPFFKEFVLKGEKSPEYINKKLLENNILGGFDIGKCYPKYKDSFMLCVTEKRSKEEIDRLVSVMEEI